MLLLWYTLYDYYHGHHRSVRLGCPSLSDFWDTLYGSSDFPLLLSLGQHVFAVHVRLVGSTQATLLAIKWRYSFRLLIMEGMSWYKRSDENKSETFSASRTFPLPMSFIPAQNYPTFCVSQGLFLVRTQTHDRSGWLFWRRRNSQSPRQSLIWGKCGRGRFSCKKCGGHER